MPLDEAVAPEGPVTAIPADKRAREAGLRGPIVLSREGALSEVQTPELRSSAGISSFRTPALRLSRIWLESLGGREFVLREDRESEGSRPCRSPRSFCRIVGRRASNRLFAIEAFIFDGQGEAVASLYFGFFNAADVPDLPLADGEEPLDALKGMISGYSLIEQAYLPPFAWKALTPTEREIAAGLAERRKAAFVAARMALKRLSRKMGLIEPQKPSRTLETSSREDRRPLMPGAGGRYHASVSHDRRFALAVADEWPVGVDMEILSPKLIRAGHIFMDEDELRIAADSGLERLRAVTRIWTAKEAASKVLNRHLVVTWRAVRLSRLGSTESVFRFEGADLTARHIDAWDRVISLVSLPGRL
ncbi:MAG: 4'-phosphopantetheinyl transferase superfamily protein [Deltaproteobacteria bacterium]|nr:4'-phosphopantetheinyl transferase superfamily protein [Deltaproteobacteria bacterium]